MWLESTKSTSVTTKITQTDFFLWVFVAVSVLTTWRSIPWLLPLATAITLPVSRPVDPAHTVAVSVLTTVGTPYNTNVGVQKIPDRAIWKPMVAKRNNTNPWSWLRPQILVTLDSGQPHMSKQPASRDWPEQIAPLMHSSQTAWQLFNLGQSIEICIPHLLGHVGQLHTKCISHIWLRFSVL